MNNFAYKKLNTRVNPSCCRFSSVSSTPIWWLISRRSLMHCDWQSPFAEEQLLQDKLIPNHARTEHTSGQWPAGMSPGSLVGRSAMDGRDLLFVVADDPEQCGCSCTFGRIRRIFAGFVVWW